MAIHRVGQRFSHLIKQDFGEGMRTYSCTGAWGSGERSVQMKPLHNEGEDLTIKLTEYQLGFTWWKEQYYVNNNMSNTFIS